MKLTARDSMTRTIHEIRADRTIEELAAFLTEHHISGAPVVDKYGKLVGVVTATDIVEDRNETGEAARVEGGRGDLEGYASLDELAGIHVKNEGRLVCDIMTPTVFTVPEDLSLGEVARAMVSGHIHRLFVTRGKEVVGIICALDLLKLFYEEPEAVRQGVLVSE
jgi:CBS domain-containing protein